MRTHSILSTLLHAPTHPAPHPLPSLPSHLPQGIVISLKDVFFEKADALVGVARDTERGCSETYTFDLNRFGPPAGAVA
jgi:hypothetical protein